MRRVQGVHLCVATLFLLLTPVSLLCGEAGQERTPQIVVYFSPRGGCTDAIVAEIDAAKRSIQVQAYSFTSAPIAAALVEAHKRGVKVQVILDGKASAGKGSVLEALRAGGVPVAIDASHAIAHNKLMMIDARVVITGSFNFTKQAEERNAENLLIIRDAGTAQRYADNWAAHQQHSTKPRAPPGAAR